jgi:hypothetical protein
MQLLRAREVQGDAVVQGGDLRELAASLCVKEGVIERNEGRESQAPRGKGVEGAAVTNWVKRLNVGTWRHGLGKRQWHPGAHAAPRRARAAALDRNL